MERQFIKKLSAVNILALLLVILSPFLFFVEKAKASANFQQVYVRPDRLKEAQTTGGLVCAKPATTQSVADVQVTFPTTASPDYVVNGTAGNWTVNTSNLPSGATAWPNIATATAVSGKTVTFDVNPDVSLTAGTLYCFNFASSSTLTIGKAGNDETGTVKTRDSGGTAIDSSQIALSVVSNDQIVVTATVPATFSFSLSGNTDALGDLSTSSIVSSPTPRTVTIATNAAQGWVAWVKSATAALHSTVAGADINTPGTVDDTPEDLGSVTGYVLDVALTTDASGGCTLQQNLGYGDEYDGDATHGGSLSTTFQPIAECVSGTANNDVITLNNRVKISSTQAAASDYTDTLTVVAAGRF